MVQILKYTNRRDNQIEMPTGRLNKPLGHQVGSHLLQANYAANCFCHS